MDNEQPKLIKTSKSKRTKSSVYSGKRKRNRLSRTKYSEKIIQIKRVTKVVKGGKKMTFRAIVILGDTKKKVGVGVGRADDVNLAIEKAVLNGKKNLITVPVTVCDSIPHAIKSSYGATNIMLRPAARGTGVIAGGPVKTVLELAGINNILSKQFGAKNILNNARATIKALTFLNEKIELGRYRSMRKQLFYEKVMKKLPNVQFSN